MTFNQIGTLREKPLHASLKRWYFEEGDAVEAVVGGFVIDLVRDDLLIEVQTRNFSAMREKVTKLLDLGHRVRIIYPIAVDKWIVKIGHDDSVIDRRLSPKHGSPVDLFTELVSLPDAILDPNLAIELVMCVQEEIRRHVPGRSWRRKGWTIVERRLIEIVDTMPVSDVDELAILLPPGLDDQFTTHELATTLGRDRRLAQQMAYCLRTCGVLETVAKHGNAIVYSRAR